MATSNKLRALNRLPYDFEDGLKVKGIDLSAPGGAAGVTYDTDNMSVQTVLDTVKPIANYSALRAYTGRATQIRITDPGIAGFFYLDGVTTSTTEDNGGTVICAPTIGAKRWKRMFDGSVNVKWFGAKGDGVTDDTVSLKVAFDYAVPNKKTIEFEGTYVISGPIQAYSSPVAVGGLHIICKGDVQITVNSSIGFSDVLYFHTTSINNASIVGGSLTIDGANKAARGITIRHNGEAGGTINISAQLSIINILEINASQTRENQALSIYGRYLTVCIEKPYVKNVNRINIAGATKGISVSQLSGTCTINQPYIENVLCVNSAGVDADGISVFGFLNPTGSVYQAREGSAHINEPIFINCQGRSFKGQISDVVIYRPRIKRTGEVVAIVNGCDFDFQVSGTVVLQEPTYEYLLYTGVSPFSVVDSSFSPVVFQQTTDNKEMSAKEIGGVMYTEVQVPRYCVVITRTGASRSVAEIDGLKVIPVGAFASSVFTRAVMELDMSTVEAKSTKTRLIVRNVEGPFTVIPAIGYTEYTSSDLSSKLSWAVTDCHSTLSGITCRAFNTISGTSVGAVESFLIRDNYRFRDIIGNANFSFLNLVPGCKFTVDLATTNSVVNPPPWGTIGYAVVEVINQWSSSTDLTVRVTVENGDKPSLRFYTRNGGASWHSEALTSDSAANIASATSATNTQNKLPRMMIFDTTNNRVMIAGGSMTTSPWYAVDGSVTVTPS